MGNIKKIDDFRESIKYKTIIKALNEDYKDDLQTVLADKEALYIIKKNDNIIIGMSNLLDCSEKIKDMLIEDGVLYDEDIKEEFIQYCKDTLEPIDNYDTVSQDEIDYCIDNILDKFDVVEQYKVVMRKELEEEPIDLSLDYGVGLLESVTLYATNVDGEEVELDKFKDIEEANEYLVDFKSIYAEYRDFRIK